MKMEHTLATARINVLPSFHWYTNPVKKFWIFVDSIEYTYNPVLY
jgi:hypothetical protein